MGQWSEGDQGALAEKKNNIQGDQHHLFQMVSIEKKFYCFLTPGFSIRWVNPFGDSLL